MIYFVSDAHLGSLLEQDSRAHEMKLVNWLEQIRADATIVYLMGDIFDFWFEYKTVVPKGFVRLFGKLAEIVDSGIEVHFFTGNHDIWAFDYFHKEIGLKVHYGPQIVEHSGKKFFLAHGDGLLNADKKFGFLRSIFHSKLLQKLFGCIPPRIGQSLGYAWSKANRERILHADNSYKGEDKEELVLFAKQYLEKNEPVDFFVFGHRHLDLNLQLRGGSQMIILGDFVSIFSYGMFDGTAFTLEYLD